MQHQEQFSPRQEIDRDTGLLRSSSWPLRILLLSATLLPLLLAGAFVWYQHAQELNEARAAAARSVVALEEHAANVLDTHSLMLRQLDGLTHGRSWEQIEGDARLKELLAQLTRDFKQVSVIGMADAQGRLRLSSVVAPAEPTTVADRDYFQAHRGAVRDRLFVAEPFVGRRSGARQLAISIVRTTPEGAFDGVIYTGVPLDYFESFWRQFAPSGGHLVPLMRADGVLLARYPALNNPERLSPDGPFMTHVRQAPRGVYTAVSRVDGVERINAYAKVKQYPLYVSFSVETRVVLQHWRANAGVAALVALLASAMLGALSVLAMRQWRGQRSAAARWRHAASELQEEVARREQAEDALRQSQKMEAVGQLAGGIAHDFNNLLAGMVGNLQLLRLRLDKGQAGDLHRYVTAAESIAARAAAMTHRLLAFSRRQTLNTRAVDLNERIRSMQDLIARTVGPAIRVQTRPGQNCTALCDENQFDNALLNLAINARDAMPAGGELAIETRLCSLHGKEAAQADVPPGEYVAVTVRDSGVGMQPDVAQRAFDPFFTTKPVGQGTGLGLSMVYGFVRQSRGHVHLDSTPGAGTSITMYLPAHEGGTAAPESTALQAAPAAQRLSRILLVDDEEELRIALAELLTELGYGVLQARAGPEALALIASEPPIDLLVTDIGLPGAMNGPRLAEAAREQRPGLKVLFITGYADRSGERPKVQQSGMEMMLKPFSLEDFANKIAALLDGGEAKA